MGVPQPDQLIASSFFSFCLCLLVELHRNAMHEITIISVSPHHIMPYYIPLFSRRFLIIALLAPPAVCFYVSFDAGTFLPECLLIAFCMLL